MNKNILLLLTILSLILIAPNLANATPTSVILTTDKSVYHPGETILFSMARTLGADTNKNYWITIRNSTTILFNISGVTPGAPNLQTFFDSFLIPSDTSNQTTTFATFQDDGATGNSTTLFNITGTATSQYLILQLNSTYQGDWYWDEQNALRAVVKNYDGSPVTGAYCKLDIYNTITGDAFYTQQGQTTGADGDVLFNIYVDYNTFDLGIYKYEIGCQYNPQLTIINNNVTGETLARGTASATFNVNPHVTINSVTLQSGQSNIYTQNLDAGCINVTNQYRDYSQDYEFKGRLQCNLPGGQAVITTDLTKIMDPYATEEYCFPAIIPEIAGSGTGDCYLQVGVTPVGLADDISGDIYDTSNQFHVTPTFATAIPSAFHKINQTTITGQFTLVRNYTTNETIRIDRAPEVADIWNWDQTKTVHIIVNNTIINCTVTIGRVSPQDANPGASAILGDLAFRNNEVQCTTPISITAGTIITLYEDVFSQTSWSENILITLQNIANSLNNILINLGFSTANPQGNYTSITGTIHSANPPYIEYALTANNASLRKQLHFQYDFAPITAGQEGAFTDQNPYVTGYQPLDLYQTIQLNQTKNYNLTLPANLPAGTYTIYETIYEITGQAPTTKTNDERIITQKTYTYTTATNITSPFNGETIQFQGQGPPSFTTLT